MARCAADAGPPAVQVLAQSHDITRDGRDCRVVVITDVSRWHRDQHREQRRLRFAQSDQIAVEGPERTRVRELGLRVPGVMAEVPSLALVADQAPAAVDLVLRMLEAP